MQKKGFVISDQGELVRMTVGNTHMDMHYTDALKLSQVLRVHAKRAKRYAGDFHNHWSVYAGLEDAEALDKMNIPANAQP